MKKTMKMKSGKTAMKIGAGLAAVGAAAAGYYFYGSKEAKNHRKIASKWAANMKKEVIREAKLLENASPKAVAVIVDRVAGVYQMARSVDAADIRSAAKELKANWEMVKREAKGTARKSISRAKATVKKRVK